MSDTEMVFMIGALRGILFKFEGQLDLDQLDILEKIDKKIQSMFYTNEEKNSSEISEDF